MNGLIILAAVLLMALLLIKFHDWLHNKYKGGK